MSIRNHPIVLFIFPALLFALSGVQACMTLKGPDPDAALAEGDFSTAIHLWTEKIKEEPENIDLLVKLGKAYLRMGADQAANPDQGGDPGSSFSDGGNLFRKALDLDPKNRDAGLGLTESLYLNNALDEARDAILKTLDGREHDGEALLWAGKVHQALAAQAEEGEGAVDLEKAKDFFQRAIAADPSLSEAYLRLGDVHFNDGDLPAALKTYEDGIASCPLSNDLNERLVYLNGQEGGIKPQDAIAFYEDLLLKPRTDEEKATLYWYMGTWYDYKGGNHYREGEFDLAAKAFEKDADCLVKSGAIFPAFKENADAAMITARLNVAYCKIYLQEYAQARDTVFTAIRECVALNLDPGENESLVQAVDTLGFNIYQDEGAEKALQFFRDLTALWAKRHQWWNDYGFFSLEVNMKTDPERRNDLLPYEGDAGKYEETYKAFKTALDLNPGYPRYMNDAAMVVAYYLDPKGMRTEEVEAMFKEAWHRGREIYESPFTEETEKQTMFSAFTDAMVNLVRLYILGDRFDDAQKVLDELLEVSPDRPEARFYKMVLERLKEGAEK